MTRPTKAVVSQLPSPPPGWADHVSEATEAMDQVRIPFPSPTWQLTPLPFPSVLSEPSLLSPSSDEASSLGPACCHLCHYCPWLSMAPSTTQVKWGRSGSEAPLPPTSVRRGDSHRHVWEGSRGKMPLRMEGKGRFLPALRT